MENEKTEGKEKAGTTREIEIGRQRHIDGSVTILRVPLFGVAEAAIDQIMGAAPGILPLDFTDHPDLLEKLQEAAKADFRTPGNQILHYISEGLSNYHARIAHT